MSKNKYAVALGKRGGASKSEAKANAARVNGKRGGRPKKVYPESIETMPQGKIYFTDEDSNS